MTTTDTLEPIQFTLPNGYTFRMMPIEGGTFKMGDEHGDLWDPCRPVHPVRLSNFYLGEFAVTQGLWRAVAELAPDFRLYPDPAHFKGEKRPVEQVSWNEIEQKFLPALRKLIQGTLFQLPTEAQWEYAARGGIFYAEAYKYAGSDKLSEIAWFGDNSENMTHEVGQKYPNQLGIYDLSGNVWEWCRDTWDEKYYQKCLDNLKKHELDLYSLENGARRVLRGGSYFNSSQYCRTAYRFNNEPAFRDNFLGFRLALQSVG